MPSRIRSIILHPAVLCALALAACVLAAHPVLEMGLDDDWSYIWSARVLADTGHVTYNGWTTAILGWQLYLGALFIKLFGFSFTIVRIPVLLLSMGTVALLQRLCVRLGLSEWNATVATLTIALSPVYMALAFSFMSDLPGFFCIILCLYMCLRAMQAQTDRAACAWLMLAAVLNALDGTVRQIAWLGVLVIVPSTTWYLRRRHGVLVTGAAGFVFGVLVIFASLRWFSRQPYALVEKAITLKTGPGFLPLLMHQLSQAALGSLVLVLPVLIAFLCRFPWRVPRARVQGSLAAAILVTAVWVQVHWGFRGFLPLPPLYGNVLGAKGIYDTYGILGYRPTAVTVPIRLCLEVGALAAAAAWLICRMNATRPESPATQDQHGSREFAYLAAPFAIAYTLLLVTRVIIYDRYTLPLMTIGVMLAVRSYERSFGGKLPNICIGLVAVFAGFGVAVIHDNFAMDRARVAAADELRRAGIPRSNIRAGFEYDAWTQLELAGYINEQRIKIPVGAYRAPEPSNVPPACRVAFQESTTVFAGDYLLAYNPLPCAAPSQFSPVDYKSWLPPFRHEILILKLVQ